MHWLSLDLSSPLASLAVHRDCSLVCERSLGDSYQHTERLLPVLQSALSEAKITLADISRFLTVSGPGSFTGLRVAMSTLKAFAMVSQKPIDSISGSEARALAWVAAHHPQVGSALTVLTFVSSGRFVVSRFTVEENGVTLLSETVDTSCETEGTILNDGRVPVALVRGDVVEFALKARHLAEASALAKSRRSFSNLGEWIALSPSYFGAQHYE